MNNRMNGRAELTADDKRLLVKAHLAARHGEPLPLDHGRQALWFLHRLAPDSPAYNFIFAADAPADLDAEAFRRAAAALVARHPALRSRIVAVDHAPQLHLDAPAAEIEFLDAEALDDDELHAALGRLADRPFDFERGPLYRLSVFRRANAHVIAFVAHHIIADLWSMDVLVSELRRLYAAELGGGPALPPSSGLTPAALVRDRLSEAYGPKGLRDLDHWLKQTDDEPQPLQLPTDRPHPPVQTFGGAVVNWTPNPQVVAALTLIARSERTTPFAAVLGLFQLFLHRICRQDDVTVGIAVADRADAKHAETIGYLVNALPIRRDFSGDDRTFRDLLRETRDDVLTAMDHQSCPLALLVQKRKAPRDPARPPLFQAMFVWDKPRPAADVPELALTPRLMEQRGAAFELTLVVFEIDGLLSMSLKYNTDLFDAATVERFRAAFDQLAEAAAARPEDLIASYGMRPAVTGINDARPAATVVPHERQFLSCLRRRAQAAPDAAAVSFGSVRLTYGELQSRIESLGGELSERGFGRGDVIGIHLPRGIDVVVTMLAIRHAGAAFVYLDPNEPVERLRAALADIRPQTIVADGAPELDGVSVVPVRAVGAARLAAESQPNDPAYLIATSGTTGRPKTAILTHGGLEHLRPSIRRWFPAEPGDRFSLTAPFHFDAAVYDVFSALEVGAELVIAPRERLLSGEAAAGFLREERITSALMVPSLLARIPKRSLPDLRRITVVGEPCPPELAAYWSRGRVMLNAYGPTEATIWATIDELHAGESPTIGKPIDGVQAHVLDRNLLPLPDGLYGELVLGGAGVGLGYRNRPDLTAEAFVPDPFAGDPDATMYRTGDSARRLPDGRLQLIGRIDDQVKIRGYRVEPDEVAAVLRSAPGVSEAVVTARPDPREPSSVTLAAFVVPAEDFSESDVRTWLRYRLPHYMVPSSLTVLAAFPVGRSGKVDRAALTALMPKPTTADDAGNEGSFLLPAIAARILKLPTAKADDNFFELGGASIQVLEFAAAANEAGVSVTPELVFRTTTLRELEAAARSGEAAGSVPPAPCTERVTCRIVGPAAIVTAPVKAAISNARTRIESLGAYLPERAVSSRAILEGCRFPLNFPIERLTGILSRRMAGDGEYSIDLAEKAARNCLERSSYRADEIDLLICCHISRCDGPNHRFSLEPTSAAVLRKRLGLTSATAFDLNNACAGSFTGVLAADALLKSGTIRTALIVSGEYITHLSRTAQLELKEFLDPQLASLTLGDAGTAVILDRSPKADVGFAALELFTVGKHHRLCVAQATDRAHGGARMMTDLINSPAVALKQGVGHAVEVLARHGWDVGSIETIVLHQTSATTIAGAVREINSVFPTPICTARNVVNNLKDRGNTASTTHFLAVWDRIREGKLSANSRALFAVTGSGQTIGTALYDFDDLPDKVVRPASPHHDRPVKAAQPYRHVRLRSPIGVRSVGIASVPGDTIPMVVEAAGLALEATPFDRSRVGLLIHSGVYRTGFLTEPAVAAIAAGELGINHDETAPTGRRSFAFDLSNGAAGTLTSLWLAGEMAAAGGVSHALILASEADENERVWPEHPTGPLRTAGALLLDFDGCRTGFTAFGVFHVSDRLDAFVSHTGAHDLRAAVHHESHDYDEVLLTAIAAATDVFLAAEGLTHADIAHVVMPQRNPSFACLAVRRAGFAAPQAVILPDVGKDYFTSGTAYAMKLLGTVAASKRVLFVEAGAGAVVVLGLFVGGGVR